MRIRAYCRLQFVSSLCPVFVTTKKLAGLAGVATNPLAALNHAQPTVGLAGLAHVLWAQLVRIKLDLRSRLPRLTGDEAVAMATSDAALLAN